MLRKQGLISLLVLVAMLFTAACQPISAQSQPAAAPPSDEDVVAAVNAIWREYEASLLAGDADRWIAQWMDNGVQMPPNMPPRVGKETIYTAVSGFLSNFKYTDFVIDNEDVEVNGDLAFARGTYAASFVAKSGGEPTPIEGKYMTILRQQADGSWKLYRDIFNSNVPPAATAPVEADTEAVTEAVNAIWDEYEASLSAGDVDRWVELWTEAGIQLPPGEPPVVGKEAIRARNKAALTDIFDIAMSITNEEVVVGGEWAVARGVYNATLTPKAGGDDVLVDGKYMTLLQRQDDGSWKIFRDIFNSNVPPAAPEANIAALSAELHQRFSDNDLEGAAELADEHMKMIGYGLGLDLEGREQFLKFMQARKRAFPDITIKHTNLVVQGHQVVVEFVATGTHLGPLMTPNGEIAATGKPVTLHVVEIHTWQDGKLVNLVQYQDPTSPLRQIGAMEQQAKSSTDVAVVTDAINAVWREYEASQLAGDPDRWIALWAEDGVQMPPGSPPVVGKAAIDARDRDDLAVNEYSEFTIENEEVEVSGDLAFARGTFKVTVAAKSGGDPMHFEGKYTTIFRQQLDGTWKIYRDTFNSNK